MSEAKSDSGKTGWRIRPTTGPWLSDGSSALQGLRMLAFLRVFAPTAQGLTLWVVTRQYGVHVPMTPVLLVLAAELAIAVATWVRVGKSPAVSELELFAQAHADILLLAVMLYFTGGASNPFGPLFVLPMAIAAAALPPRLVWVTAFSTMVAYTLLRHHHLPLFHPRGETEVYELHEDGMVVNYLFTAALLAFFVVRMRATFIRQQRILADARESQLRNESVVAIGALAAGYAHELSTPLATMLVVVSELKRERQLPPDKLEDIQLLEDQIMACKQIVTNLASAGGQRRAESASQARLDEFIGQIVDKARSLHPDATILASIDSVTPPPRIVADETLRQAITNLITNAAKASPQHVEVRADWAGSDLVLVVSDRGPGVEPQVLDMLGKPIEGSPTRGSGMGLGLMLGASTLDRLGGRLELVNQASGGARAEVRVPLRSISINPTHHDENGPPKR